MMRKNSSLIAVLMVISCIVASCSTDDTTSVSYSNDAAITSFTLGTVKVYSTVKASTGEDSTVTTSYSGSIYSICIDQLKRDSTGEIFNSDSLPLGTKMKMLATVSSKNYGTILYQKWSASPTDSAWTYYSSTDSINFTDSLRFRVWSTDRTSRHDYLVNIKRHTEPEDSFVWDTLTARPFFMGPTTMTLKGIATSKGLYVLTNSGLYFSSDLGATWSNITTIHGTSIAAMNDTVYVLNGNTLYTYPADAGSPRNVSGSNIVTLAGSCDTQLYAINSNGTFSVSTDKGVSWTTDKIEEYYDATPAKNVCYSNQPSAVNTNLSVITVIGNNAACDTCVIWNKSVNKKTHATADPWTQTTTIQGENVYVLPALGYVSSCGYGSEGEYLMAVGTDHSGSYQKIYMSSSDDNGITWKTKAGLRLPANSITAPALIMSDNKGYFYLINPNDGGVYRGKLNNVMWIYRAM